MALDDEAVYYDIGGIETIDIIRAKLTPEEFRGFLLGNALKYLCRCGWKTDNHRRDVEKARNYLDLLLKDLDK